MGLLLDSFKHLFFLVDFISFFKEKKAEYVNETEHNAILTLSNEIEHCQMEPTTSLTMDT